MSDEQALAVLRAARIVAPLFQSQDWKWAHETGDNMKVPSAGKIFDTLSDLVQLGNATVRETGRLVARWDAEADRIRMFLEIGSIEA